MYVLVSSIFHCPGQLGIYGNLDFLDVYWVPLQITFGTPIKQDASADVFMGDLSISIYKYMSIFYGQYGPMYRPIYLPVYLSIYRSTLSIEAVNHTPISCGVCVISSPLQWNLLEEMTQQWECYVVQVPKNFLRLVLVTTPGFRVNVLWMNCV